VQGPRVLSVLWRAPHGRARGAPRGSRLAGGAPETVGAHPAATRPLRPGLAPDLSTAVAGMLFRAVHRHLRTSAQTRRLGDARSGDIIVVQRFPPRCAQSAQWRPRASAALNLNVHLHALVLDGVFAHAEDGKLRFHRAPPPSAADVADVLAAIMPQARARLARVGLEDDDRAEAFAVTEPGLAGLAAASVQGVGLGLRVRTPAAAAWSRRAAPAGGGAPRVEPRYAPCPVGGL
jgi:hypothetical protein